MVDKQGWVMGAALSRFFLSDACENQFGRELTGQYGWLPLFAQGGVFIEKAF